MINDKNDAAERLDFLSFLLGSDTIEKELICYLSVQELRDFIGNIEALYDVEQYEETYERIMSDE